MQEENTYEDYRLNSQVIRLMHQYSSMNFKRFSELGVHPGQIPVLRVIHEKEGISLREMADFLHIKPPTVTVTVKRLEKAGFLCRKPDWRDNRISRIYETEKGKELSRQLMDQVKENEKLLTDGFSREEKEQLCDFFRRMSENMARKGTPCMVDVPEQKFENKEERNELV